MRGASRRPSPGSRAGEASTCPLREPRQVDTRRRFDKHLLQLHVSCRPHLCVDLPDLPDGPHCIHRPLLIERDRSLLPLGPTRHAGGVGASRGRHGRHDVGACGESGYCNTSATSSPGKCGSRAIPASSNSYSMPETRSAGRASSGCGVSCAARTKTAFAPTPSSSGKIRT